MSLSILTLYLHNNSWRELGDILFAAQISVFNWGVIAFTLLLIPIILWYIVRVTQWFSSRYPLTLQTWKLLVPTIFFSCLIPLQQYYGYMHIEPYIWNRQMDALPFHFSLFDNRKGSTSLTVKVKPYQRLDIQASLQEVSAGHLPKHMNVFVFIAETVREDYVTPEVTPNLSTFRDKNISFRHSFSSANSTHYSWFSIFYSTYPIYWNSQRKYKNQLGAPALQIFKKAGFKIHLYSKSHHMRYLGFQNLIYGEEARLIDSAAVEPDGPVTEADSRSVDKLVERIHHGVPPGRNLFIIFLDSTHHNYFFPKDFPLKFQPIVDDFSYLKWDYSPDDVVKISNRYKNSLYYLDSLFGKVINALVDRGIYNQSIIGFVTDHGEEFMEHGALIHGNNIFDTQFRTPTYYHAPKIGAKQINQTISGVDFLPTLLDLTGLYDQTIHLYQGRSKVKEANDQEEDIALLTNNHADADPYEFALFNGRHKLMIRLDPERVLTAQRATFPYLYDLNDQIVPISPGESHRMLTYLHLEFRKSLKKIPYLEFPDLP